MGDITLVGAGHFLLGSLLSYDILLHKDRPVSAVLWLFAVWTLPFLGALGYLSFGMDRVQRGAADRQASGVLVERRARMHPTFERHVMDRAHFDLSDPHDHPGAHIFRGTDPAVARNHVLRGNRAELLVDGDEFYPALLEAVEGAEASIHVQTYIFGRDRIGRRIRDALATRAREGVRVRLLYDRFGSTRAHFLRFLEEARRAGVDVRSISQANPLKGRFQVNLRNHRKIAVVDGRTGFVGGINFQDGHATETSDGPPIRDYHVRLRGPAVADLQFQFVQDWVFAAGTEPDRLLGPRYFPDLESEGDALVQVVPGGPEMEGQGLADAIFGAISAAEHSLWVVTPYFVPDEPILQAIRYAALRGVDVRLVVPRRSNHRYAEYAARALYTQLLRAGVRIFERGPPFLHAKALVADGAYAMLGSANLDYRSLHLNFETNVEVGDRSFARTVERQVEEEMRASREIELQRHLQRSLPRRLAENFCLLFQPVL
jgi:cardiolipin synthase